LAQVWYSVTERVSVANPSYFQSFHRSVKRNALALRDADDKAAVSDLDGDNTKKVAATEEVIDEKNGQFVAEKSTLQSAVSTSDVSSESASLDDSEKLTFRGFRNNILGTTAFLSCIIITLLFLVFLGCVVGDYCKFESHTRVRARIFSHEFTHNTMLLTLSCTFSSIDGTVDGVVFGIFLASDLSSQIFAAVWHIGGAWFVVMNLTRHRMRNYFRIESYAHESPYVQIEKKQDQIVFLDDSGRWMKRLQAAEQWASHLLG
jgi:cation-transporting ATPase 13A3/4/5